MRRVIGVVGLLAIVALLALGTGKATRAGNPFTIMVGPVPNGCETTIKPVYATIHEALAAAVDGDYIYVCPGTYVETAAPTLSKPNVSVQGASTATVTVSLDDSLNYGTVLTILAAATNATITGMTIDATASAAYSSTTTGINVAASNAQITGNHFVNATANAVIVSGTTVPTGTTISGNSFELAGYGIYCLCDSATIDTNLFGPPSPAVVLPAIYLSGDAATLTNNTFTNSSANIVSDSATISGNHFTGEAPQNNDQFQLLVIGNDIDVDDNTFADSGDHGGAIEAASVNDPTVVTLKRNHFGTVKIGIQLYDVLPNSATVTATINGGQAEDANVFTDPDNTNDFVYLLGNTANVDAENNNWGVCTEQEIQAKIYDHTEDNTLGMVDTDPFIAANCQTDTPTPSPSPTASPTHTPTPTPNSSETATVTASPTPVPTASPAGQLAWGDIDCDGSLAPLDGLKLLDHVAELTVTQTQPCPEIGSSTNISIAAGAPHTWGDIDCDTDVDVSDVLGLLSGVEGMPLDNLPDGCPVVGGGVIVISG